MVPSWFVPPIGIVVADVTFPEVAVLLPFAKVLFWMGAAAYAVLLPLMIYRLFFLPEVPNGAKPTIAILAAPASLLLAGYLTVEKDPSLLLVALLFGIAILMTVVIYFAFWRLLRLQFSPGYAAFTFPMAIGATALYKLSNLVAGFPGALHYAHQIRFLAHVEVTVAAVVMPSMRRTSEACSRSSPPRPESPDSPSRTNLEQHGVPLHPAGRRFFIVLFISSRARHSGNGDAVLIMSRMDDDHFQTQAPWAIPPVCCIYATV